MIVDDKYDFVFFWKQNDSGIYGRRQDMIVKYLSLSEKVNQIIHFDAPLSFRSLTKLFKCEKANQSNLILYQTLQRVLRLKHTRKVKNYTFVYGSRPSALNGSQLASPSVGKYCQFIDKILTKHEIGQRKTIFYVCPVNFEFPEIASRFTPQLILADVIDDQRAFRKRPNAYTEKMAENYKQILGLSDLVITNCQGAKESIGDLADEITIIPNACEFPGEKFNASIPKALTKLKGPIIGYVGNLSSRIDIELLEKIAIKKPHWNIVLIGSAHLSREILRLDKYSNVHFLGVIPYEKVNRYIDHFDVAIIPHARDKLTETMNPLKLFVYCSRGIPVVSTEVDNIDELRELVSLAGTHEDFLAKTESILVQKKESKDLTKKDRQLLQKNSWNARVDALLDLIDRHGS